MSRLHTETQAANRGAYARWSGAWIARCRPLLDAPPELIEEGRRYLAARIRRQGSGRLDVDAARALDDAEDAVFRAVGVSQAFFVFDSVVLTVKRSKRDNRPLYVEIEPRCSPWPRRPILED